MYLLLRVLGLNYIMYLFEVSAVRLTLQLMGTMLKVSNNSKDLSMVVRTLEIDTSPNAYYSITVCLLSNLYN